MAEELKLRPYQLEAQQAIRNYKGDLWPLIHQGTGTGKTAQTVALMGEHDCGIWLAPNDRLINQARDEFCTWNPGLAHETSTIGAGCENNYEARYLFAKKGSVKTERVGHRDIIVCDEGHHLVGQYLRVTRAIEAGSNGPRVVVLTATPERLDDFSLGEICETVYVYDYLDAVEAGYNLPVYATHVSSGNLDLSKVGMRGQDFASEELIEELMRAQIVKHTVDAMNRTHTFKRLPWREDALELSMRDVGSIILYCVNIEHAAQTAAALKQDGWASDYIYANAPNRDEVVALFEAGEIQVIVNVGILIEGVDIRRAHAIVDAAPTMSRSRHMQKQGRVVRQYEDQTEAYYLDLVGNTRMHHLISAPVLIMGQECDYHPDHKHRFIVVSGGGMVCECGATAPCSVHVKAHRFKEGLCACGEVQCPESPDKTHVWVNMGEGQRQCMVCGAETWDRFAALWNKKLRLEPNVDWYWLSDQAHVAVLRDHGLLYRLSVGHLEMPLWYHRGELKQLSRGPVPPKHAMALCGDVARRTKKFKKRYGYVPIQSRGVAVAEARRIANKLGLEV